MEYHVGTSGFHYNHWRGVFYPPELPTSGWLNFYAGHFSTVELNNPFYRLPTEKAFEGWREGTPRGFLFAVKASRFITHIKRLRDAAEPLETFLSRARVLKEKLGPVLYQTPPQMRRDDARLEAFLRLLPRDLGHVFEFRHRSWYDDQVYALLRRYNVAFCVQDMAGLETPLLATADFAYVRFHGTSGLYSGCYSDDDLKGWAAGIQELARGLRSVYIYFNNDAEGWAVKNAQTIRHLL